MHKSSFKKFFLLASLCFSTAILNSCSDIDTQDTTSITIDIPTKALSSARDVVLREDDNLIIDDASGHDNLMHKMHALVVVSGEYNKAVYTKIPMNFNQNEGGSSSASITIDSVPIGSNVQLDVSIFETWGNWRYYGASKSFTVSNGVNVVPINMTIPGGDNSAPNNEITLLDINGFSNFSISFNNDHTYIIKDSVTSYPYSQGKYTESADGNIIYFTEYCYTTFKIDEQSLDIIRGDTVIVTDPKVIAVPDNSGGAHFNMRIPSKNGAIFETHGA